MTKDFKTSGYGTFSFFQIIKPFQSFILKVVFYPAAQVKILKLDLHKSSNTRACFIRTSNSEMIFLDEIQGVGNTETLSQIFHTEKKKKEKFQNLS